MLSNHFKEIRKTLSIIFIHFLWKKYWLSFIQMLGKETCFWLDRFLNQYIVNFQPHFPELMLTLKAIDVIMCCVSSFSGMDMIIVAFLCKRRRESAEEVSACAVNYPSKFLTQLVFDNRLNETMWGEKIEYQAIIHFFHVSFWKGISPHEIKDEFDAVYENFALAFAMVALGSYIVMLPFQFGCRWTFERAKNYNYWREYRSCSPNGAGRSTN